MIHKLKIRSEFFNAIISGDQTFELRKDNQPNGPFRAGDYLLLCETNNNEYTGRELKVYVPYLISGLGLAPDWVCMSIKKQSEMI
jgi:hypothetical protein